MICHLIRSTSYKFMNTLVWVSWSLSCVSTAIYFAPSVVVISCSILLTLLTFSAVFLIFLHCFSPCPVCLFVAPSGMFSSDKKKLRHSQWFITLHVFTQFFFFSFVILLFKKLRLQNTTPFLSFTFEQ